MSVENIQCEAESENAVNENNTDSYQSLPSSVEAERAILGFILLDNSVMGQTVGYVEPEDFHHPAYATVYRAMLNLFDRSEPIDPVLVGEELNKARSLEAMGGVPFITDLTYGLPFAHDISSYLEIVRGKSDLRKLVRACNAIIVEACDQVEDPRSILESAEARVYGVIDRGVPSTAEPMERPVAHSIELTKDRANNPGTIIGLRVGYTDLDAKLQGYRPGQYIVTAGRPGMGKTSLAVGKLYHAAVKENTPSLIFSLEMSKEEISERVICSVAEIDTYMYRAGRLSEAEWLRVEQIKRELEKTNNLFINDDPLVTVRTIRAEMRRVNSSLRRTGRRIGFVVVDHVGLVRNDIEKRGRSREGEVSEISRSLKGISREFECAVNALSQLNRQSEGRADHRPAVSDLRESGSLEQDADVVELLYREDAYITDPSMHTNIAEVIVGKNRNGPTGPVKLRFDRRYTRFSNLLSNTREMQERQDRLEQTVLI